MKKRISIACMALAVATTFSTQDAAAQSQEGFLGEIRYFAGNFAPRNWAFCEGQLLPISNFSALFSILGCTYGGDCRTTFALPDMRGRTPIGVGTGPGLPTYNLAQRVGSATNTMNVNEMPSHGHTGVVRGSSANGTLSGANGAVLATPAAPIYAGRVTPDVNMAANTVQTDNTGGNQSQNNMQPSLGLNCIIATQGLFPSRN